MNPDQIVHLMLRNDFFSQWLGIRLLEVRPGFCCLFMQVRKEMLNGFGIAHGGITYSLADSALAFASNAGGKKSLSIETSIHHLEKVKENDELKAIASLEFESEKFGHYSIRIFSSDSQGKEKIVAYFKGIVYRTSQNW